jgi:aminoglycoside phosphotransferase (APT) family kinase protein
MDQAGLESGPILDPVLLSGGTQNILIQFRRGQSQFVLRRPPQHPRSNSNETMIREATVLSALNGADIPHPRMIAACPDTEPLGCAFYLMERVDGFNAPMGLPPLHAGNPSIRHAMGLALAQSAAALGELDYEKVGLAKFGKPEGFLQRQAIRWRRQLESYGEIAGWPGIPRSCHVDKICSWLEEKLPLSSYRPGLIHGDYHIANALFRRDGPQLAAIVDWELATIGDPLLDLGWLLATWPDETGDLPEENMRVSPGDGFPTQSELIEHYARFSTRDMRTIPWYVVLACYKLGIILEGTYARACEGKASSDTAARLHRATLKLFARALEWMARD